MNPCSGGNGFVSYWFCQLMSLVAVGFSSNGCGQVLWVKSAAKGVVGRVVGAYTKHKIN